MYYDFIQYTDAINSARMLLSVVFIQYVKLIILQNYICIYIISFLSGVGHRTDAWTL